MIDPRLSALTRRLASRGVLTSQPQLAKTDPAIGSVRYDSRQVESGDLFVARVGQHADGHDHVSEAVAAGAAALIVEHPVAATVPQLVVGDAKAALAEAAAWRAGDPSRELGVIGITGTDGKTTTAYLVRAILEATAGASGLMGTTDVVVGGASLGNPARTTTPEAPELQGYLADMLASGDRWAIVESTSHGLAQQRVGAVAYDVAVLTNITSEHLEFHGTLEAYRAAKLRLFAALVIDDANPDKGWGKWAVVNANDPSGEAAATAAAAAGAEVLRYGLGSRLGDSTRPALDLAATSVMERPAAMDVAVETADWTGGLTLRLAGRFNVANALAALGVAKALDIDLDRAAMALASLQGVPGRMQRIDEGQPFSVIIDYAHTAESLGKVLDELAPRDDHRLIVVFGSAGDRDASKREPMGRVAGERCHTVVVTDEDSRSEDRTTILEAIAAGAASAGKRRGDDLFVIPDRADAIGHAIALARPGDVVLLAGKGHEKTIETSGGEQPWDEEETARQALRRVVGA